MDCRIMVLASRTSGRTVEEIKKLEPQGWEIRWEQNEHPTDPSKFDECNQKYAQKVVDMIIERITAMNKR